MIEPRKRLASTLVQVVLFTAALTTVLLLAWFAYHPGLSGVFLFDDFNNLSAIGATGPIDHWATFWRYITSGQADPTGRPLTLLSFLIDAQNWPADPWPFKYTSLLLHLLNGLLLSWVMLRFARRAGLTERHGMAAATLTAAFWLLHPLFVSTTLYIVQREAMLPATFTFVGLLCWCSGRDRLDAGRKASAWLWMILGAWLCTILATLCKANGALLPLLILMAEATILRTQAHDAARNIAQRLQRARWILLGLPVALLVLGLIAEIPGSIRAAAANRPWTIGQRLLSEPRVLMDYLRLLWLPRATSYGLFNDQVRASTDWLHPWTTLPCIVAVFALIAGAWLLRKRHPFLAFAILFYFAAQIMESSFIPLELAFEHRNYLPAAFMFWPLALWLMNTGGHYRFARALLVLVAVAGLALLTHARAAVWGNAAQQALIWGKINPDSGRAQAYAAAAEQAYKRPVDAIRRLRKAAGAQPDSLQLTLNLASTECRTDVVTTATWQRVLYSLQHTMDGTDLLYNWFVDTVPKTQHHVCGGLTLQTLQQALAAARVNPKFAHLHGPNQNYDHIAGLIDLAMQRPRQALDDFNNALAESPKPGTALQQAALLGASGYPAYGLKHLDFARTQLPRVKPALGMPMIHAWVLERQHYWQNETAHLRATLTADATAQAAKTAPVTN